MCQELNISKVFVGVVLLPLVGNATEHLVSPAVGLYAIEPIINIVKSLHNYAGVRCADRRHGGGKGPYGACHGYRRWERHAGMLEEFPPPTISIATG